MNVRVGWKACLCSLIVLNTVCTLECLSFEEDQTSTNRAIRALERKVTQEWKPIAMDSENLFVTFSTTAKAEPYALELRHGTSVNSSEIRAVIRAIFAAFSDQVMSLANKEFKCTFKSDSKHSSVTVTCSRKPEINPSEIELGQIEYLDRKSVDDGIVRMWMIDRLHALDRLFFKYPDSKVLEQASDEAAKCLGISTSNQHDWQIVARAAAPVSLDFTTEEQRVSRIRAIESSAGAYYRAWKIKRSQLALRELEEAYLEKLVLNQTASPAESVRSKSDIRQILQEQSQVVGDTKAIEENKNKATGTQNTFTSIGNDWLPTTDRAGWKKMIKWMPDDIETLILSQRSVSPFENKSENINSVQSYLENYGSCTPHTENNSADKGTETSDVLLNLSGARAFKAPEGLGVGAAQVVNVKVFQTPDAAQRYMQLLKIESKFYDQVDGIDVFALVSPRGTSGTTVTNYFCIPYKNVVVNSTRFSMLEEVLIRLKTRPAKRALPDHLPEWAEVPADPQFFALRHFDKVAMPFDRTALINNVQSRDNFGYTLDRSSVGFVLAKAPLDGLHLKYLEKDPKSVDYKSEFWKSIIPQDRRRSVREIVNLDSHDKYLMLEMRAEKSEASDIFIAVLNTLGININL